MHLHILGISGTFMGSLAALATEMGHRVTGADLNCYPPISDQLHALNIEVIPNYDAEQLEINPDLIVIGNVMSRGMPIIEEILNRKINFTSGPKWLADNILKDKTVIAVSGTHGKTTTTTMVSTLLHAGGFDPTVVNGGVIHAFESNARTGQGEWMVVEADESDGTFNRLPATIAVVTNIDPEHMEHWGSFDNLRQGFFEFVHNIPFYGLAVCNTDHAEVQALVGRITDRRVMTYGFNAQADVRAVNLAYEKGAAFFDVALRDGRVIADCTLPMPGDHNVSNALAAVAVALHLGMSAETIRDGLRSFKGVNRRFTRVAEIDGVTVIDDYAHHPVEIAAALKAARQSHAGRIMAVHQPHRYSRLSDLFEEFCTCFNDADVVGITDIFAAGEAPIEGADRDSLVAGLTNHGHRNAVAVADEAALDAFLAEQCRPGDMLICLGAGSISAWAHGLAGEVE